MHKGFILIFIMLSILLYAASIEAYDKEVLERIMPESDLFKEKSEPFIYHEAYKDRSLIGYCFSTKEVLGGGSRGFGGPMDILVAIDIYGKIENVYILEHNETPEYAAALTERFFLDQFKGKAASDHFKVGEDVDAVTRATISSQSVADILKAGILKMELIFDHDRDRTLKPIDAVSLKAIDSIKKAGLEPREAEYYRIIDE